MKLSRERPAEAPGLPCRFEPDRMGLAAVAMGVTAYVSDYYSNLRINYLPVLFNLGPATEGLLLSVNLLWIDMR
ncbi:MAG TPA: hypothetical protein EYG42_00295 [Porticoccaceae bacterium]|nr:hypothetical protein [Porticoccaceae bacterium]